MTNAKNRFFYNRRNLVVFALLVFAGVAFFFLRPAPPLQETDLLIPINFGKAPAGLTVTGSPLKGIEVRIRGSESGIRSLLSHKLNYRVDLSRADIGIITFPIDKNLITLPKDIAIVKVDPSSLTVRIEKEITKELPVIISFADKPGKGFIVMDAIAKPDSVIVRGPEDILSPLEKVSTKPIDLKGVSESFKKEIALSLPERINVIFPSGIMRAEVSISQKIISRQIKDIPVKGKNTPYRYLITPSVISIEIKGPMNTLAKVQNGKEIQVYVDLKGLKPGVYPRRAAITLPPSTTLADARPELFTVKIEKTKKAASQ